MVLIRILSIVVWSSKFKVMSSDECDLKDVEANWNKIERDLIKVGLKDGLSDGRDSNFQSSFDKGYADGFQNGFQLGKLQFMRSVTNNLASAEATGILDKASKGMCIVCTTGKDNENVAEIRRKQSELLALTVAGALKY
ncbi:uncharacterized protein LOC109545008 isoform X1 [Dendroctonus ponderosae]|nr:uncharacterized protein LOC109545008 isoform X1 [Dendroctonus ponderosae]